MPQFLNLHPQTASTTVRTSLKSGVGPIQCAESDGDARLSTRALVLPQLLKTFKIPQFINLHAKTASSTVSTSFNRVYGPIRCAESNGVVRLAVLALVLEIWWKTCPILRFSKPPATDSFFYCQNIIQVGRWTYPMR